MELGSNIDNDWHSSLCNSVVYMLKKEIETDVTFSVGILDGSRQQVNAHKVVLIARSPVFYAMLCGPLRESSNNITIPDVDSEAFKLFLRLLYEDDDVNLDESNAAAMYYLAKKYLVRDIELRSRSFLQYSISESNVCSLYDSIFLTGDTELSNKCICMIDENLSLMYSSDDFKNFSPAALAGFVSSKITISSEAVIFRACIIWAQHRLEEEDKVQTGSNIRKELSGILEYIHFPALNPGDFRPYKGLLTKQEMKAVLAYQQQMKKQKEGESGDVNTDFDETVTSDEDDYETCSSDSEREEDESVHSASSRLSVVQVNQGPSTSQSPGHSTLSPCINTQSPSSNVALESPAVETTTHANGSLNLPFPTHNRGDVIIILKRKVGPELTYNVTFNVREMLWELYIDAARAIGCEPTRLNLYTEDGFDIEMDWIKTERQTKDVITLKYSCIMFVFDYDLPSGSDCSGSLDFDQGSLYGDPMQFDHVLSTRPQSDWTARPVRYNNHVYNPLSRNPQIVINFARDVFDKFVFDRRTKEVFRARMGSMVICHNLDTHSYYLTSSQAHDWIPQNRLIDRLNGHIEEMHMGVIDLMRDVLNQYKERIFFMFYALRRFQNQPERSKRFTKHLPP